MLIGSIWIVGSVYSGKTGKLIESIAHWDQQTQPGRREPSQRILVFAANGDNRLELADRILASTHSRVLFDSNTPLGFFQHEVTLFWPLLAERLDLGVQFPLRLRPETEQDLATQLWQPELDSGQLAQPGITDYFMVRRSLDLLQLAASGGIPLEDMAQILKDGFRGQEIAEDLWDCIETVLLRWRNWCLERGLLTYGILTELYWRYLLPHPTYQHQLIRRYAAVVADDVDEYPAIAYTLFNVLLDHKRPGMFTYNPDGANRLGLGADPHCLSQLAERCRVELVDPMPEVSLGATWGEAIAKWVSEPTLLPELPPTIQVIQTTSRAELLRQTAEEIATAIHTGEVKPEEVAVIAPGLDAIARYTLRTLLTNRSIPIESLNEQQPLISYPLVRALLTLMALVYPGLGRLVNREAAAELLVVLSPSPVVRAGLTYLDTARIDPVRAGLITDHCFVPDPERPRLLPVTHFPRWDRLGYQATAVYNELIQWIEAQQVQQQQRLLPSPVTLLDRAIQRFLGGGNPFSYDQLAVLRELMETAQHYWEVDTRLRQTSLLQRRDTPIAETVGQFIQLLRNGTITADPYPARPLNPAQRAVTLATIFQYRSYRRYHRWQFWLDTGSAFWLSGGGGLFGAPLFLREWSGRPWTAADTMAADQQRLRRQLIDLLGRTGERVYLCHSDLATNGQEQGGPLLTLINAALPVIRKNRDEFSLSSQ